MSQVNLFNTFANVFNLSSEVDAAPKITSDYSFYLVSLAPGASYKDGDVPPFIFDSLPKTLEFCKKYKECQPKFHKFGSHHEAEESYMESVGKPAAVNTSVATEKKGGEKSSSFRAPNAPKMRRAIMAGNLQEVKELIASNPRFIIGSGDTPTIVQEGCRYNALHEAARSNQSTIMEEIIRALRDENLYKKMYPDDTPESIKNTMKFLIDLYLNTPDKTRKGETPLHFACKLGSYECAKVLLDQKECVRNIKNLDGKVPREIICERTGCEPPELYNKISALFDSDDVIIPILSDSEGLAVTRLGDPFPSRSDQFDINNVLPPREQPSFHQDSPLRTTGHTASPLRPPISNRSDFKISAYLGPISSSAAPGILSELKSKLQCSTRERLRDADKGLECVVRDFCREADIPWNEYWDFLDKWVDLASTTGLRLLEQYFIDHVTSCKQEANGVLNGSSNGMKSPIRSPMISRILPKSNNMKSPTPNQESARSVMSEQNFTKATQLLTEYLECLLCDDEPQLDPLLAELVNSPINPNDHPKIATIACKKVRRLASQNEIKTLCKDLQALEDTCEDDCIRCLLTTCIEILCSEASSIPDENTNLKPCSCGDSKSLFEDDAGECASEKSFTEDIASIASSVEYIHGTLPTKTDRNVFNSLKPVLPCLDKAHYPCIMQWSQNVSSYSTVQMDSWYTPIKLSRNFANLTSNSPLRSPLSPLCNSMTSTPRNSHNQSRSFDDVVMEPCNLLSKFSFDS